MLHRGTGREPDFEPGAADASNHLAVTAGKIVSRRAIERGVERTKFFENPFGKREICAHGRLSRIERTDVGAEGKRRMPFAHPIWQAVGKHGNDFAADG